MLEILGENYYIDFDEIHEKCKTGNIVTDDEQNEVLEINFFKYETIKMCIERILNEFENPDDEMGSFAQKDLSISFKIAFNSLLNSNILLIHEDNE